MPVLVASVDAAGGLLLKAALNGSIIDFFKNYACVLSEKAGVRTKKIRHPVKL